MTAAAEALASVLHRRFADDHGNTYVYVATSAAILQLDPLAAAALDAFAVDGGAAPDAWIAAQESP